MSDDQRLDWGAAIYAVAVFALLMVAMMAVWGPIPGWWGVQFVGMSVVALIAASAAYHASRR